MLLKLRFVLLWLMVMISLLAVLNSRISIGSTEVPALGSFLSPFHGFWVNAEPFDESSSFSMLHPSVSSEIEIVLDERMVPHIFGENLEDLAFAMGYMQAYHRLWQMDITVRSITGRLSEVIGEKALSRDIETRREGFEWAIDKALALYSKDEQTMAVLQAFADGVNLRIKQLKPKDYPIEFKLLGYKPEAWTVRHSVAASKSMARVLTMKNYDIQNTGLVDVLGKDLFEMLFPIHMQGADPVHPGPWESLSPQPKIENLPVSKVGIIGQVPNVNEDQHLASNNWAIASKKSQSGNPILCNDPHLALTLPSVWYEVHLVSPTFNLYGVSLLGLPFVPIGFNEYVAWGITNGGTDVLDYLKVTWQDSTKTSYLFEDEWIKADVRTETIKIKGGKTHIEKVPYTVWGPVKIQNDNALDSDLTMHWSGHDALNQDELTVFVDFAEAKSLEDYKKAMRRFPSPIQNIAFATSEGDIALRSQGFWPFRTNESGRFIADAASSNSSWSGYLTYDYIPATINPERGYVSSANQESTDPSYPYLYFGSYENYRGRTLNRLLESQLKFSIDDMKRFQLSNFSLHAAEALPVMLIHLDYNILNDSTKNLVALLKDWDFNYDKESAAPLFFNEWFSNIKSLTFDETSSQVEKQFRRFPDSWILPHLLRNEPNHSIFNRKNTGIQETGPDIVNQAFLTAWEQTKIKCPNPLDCPWAVVRKTNINHLASIDAFSVKANTSGTPSALNAISETHGPSWRQVIELTPEGPIAFGIFPGGQSGNPGSRYYDDSIDKWVNEEYHSLQLYRKAEDVPSHLVRIKVSPK